MTIDNKRAPDEVDDDFDSESHAADEPTAVWDESALRAAGLSDLLKQRESEPPPPPATTPTASVKGDPSIVIEQEVAPRVATPVPQAPSESGGLGWSATLGIAVALGAIVYLLIRFVKG